MKKTYHLCLSAGEEVMFRDLEDYNRGFNSFAIALYKTGSTTSMTGKEDSVRNIISRWRLSDSITGLQQHAIH